MFLAVELIEEDISQIFFQMHNIYLSCKIETAPSDQKYFKDRGN